MTRTTLKALWFGGGGVLATWFAVSPNTGRTGCCRSSRRAERGDQAERRPKS